MLVLNKSADKLKGCAAKPRTLSPARCARGRRDKLTHLMRRKRYNEKAREGAETPADPLWRFPRFLSRALYMLYFLPCHLGDKPVFICFLSLAFPQVYIWEFIFQVSLFPRSFLKALQNTVSKTLRISPLLTTRNDFFPFLNSKIFRSFASFPFFSPNILYHIFSNPVRTFTDTFPSLKVSKTATMAHYFFPPHFLLLRLLFREAMVA